MLEKGKVESAKEKHSCLWWWIVYLILEYGKSKVGRSNEYGKQHWKSSFIDWRLEEDRPEKTKEREDMWKKALKL